MKQIVKTLFLTVAAMGALTACKKWTETESIKVTYETIETKNPDLYAKYIASIFDYHQTDHQVLIAKFDNVPGVPAVRTDHINALPDSVDYVVLTKPENLSEATLREAGQMRADKGIKTLMQVDLSAAVASYDAVLDAEWEAYEAMEEPTEEDIPVDTPERLQAFVTPIVEAALKAAGDLDGIHVVFSAMNPIAFSDEKRADVTARQEVLFAPVNAWLSDRADALVFFEGIPGHIICATPVIERARYIVVPAYTANNVKSISYEVGKAMIASPGMPTDRMVAGVATIDPFDLSNTEGYFDGGMTAVEGAGYWSIASEPECVKKGVCVSHAQYGYYGKERVYAEMSKAISVMNPSISK